MLKEVKCLSCGSRLFRIGPLDEKGEAWGIFEDDQKHFESICKQQGGQEFYACSVCGKKNWTASQRVAGQGERVWISHVTE